MMHLKEIFGVIMIKVTPTEIFILGAKIPIASIDGSKWAEFTTWANITFSPDLKIEHCYWADDSHCSILAKIAGVFNEKSASILKVCGIKKWSIETNDLYDDDGRPGLFLNIPCTPDV